MTVFLKLNKIIVDSNIQVRSSLSEERISEFMELYEKLPPIKVVETKSGECYLADGFHRYEAAKRKREAGCQCEIEKGDLKHALEIAIQNNCFPAGTKIVVTDECVEINDGYCKCGCGQKVSGNNAYINGHNSVHDKTKSIEDIKIGDMVLSYDEKTGIKEYKRVTKTFSRKNGNFVTIFLSNDNKLRMTSEHPVAVNVSGELRWIAAKDLKIGDELIQYNYGALNLRINNIKRKGKSFEEIFGSDAERIKKEISDATRWENEVNRKDKTFEEIFGDKANDIKNHMSFSMRNGYRTGKRQPSFKNKTFAEVMGEEKAKERIAKMSLVRKGKSYEQLFGEEKAKEMRKKCSDTAKRINLSMLGRLSANKKTGLEIKLDDMLNEICPGKFLYNGDGKVTMLESVDGHKIIPDFVASDGIKKCIEVFNRFAKLVYWSNCNEYKEWRSDQLSKIGYDTIFIDDSEIDDFDLINQKVSSFVYNPNVKIVKITNIDHENVYDEDVFNLEVEDNNNYFAYGILVHNCKGPLSLSRDEKRSLVDKTLRFFPERANSWIADMIGVSMQLVDSRRLALESDKVIKKYDKLDTRDGRSYPREVTPTKVGQVETDSDLMDLMQGRGKMSPSPVVSGSSTTSLDDLIAKRKSEAKINPEMQRRVEEARKTKVGQLDASMFVDGVGLISTAVSEDGISAIGIKGSDDGGYMLYVYEFAGDRFFPASSIYFSNESLISFLGKINSFISSSE